MGYVVPHDYGNPVETYFAKGYLRDERWLSATYPLTKTLIDSIVRNEQLVLTAERTLISIVSEELYGGLVSFPDPYQRVKDLDPLRYPERTVGLDGKFTVRAQPLHCVPNARLELPNMPADVQALFREQKLEDPNAKWLFPMAIRWVTMLDAYKNRQTLWTPDFEKLALNIYFRGMWLHYSHAEGKWYIMVGRYAVHDLFDGAYLEGQDPSNKGIQWRWDPNTAL